ncbi:hypothetical protein BX666DRAFT_609623 [Dichotomocladium elegans]|nr:hypothetical protein BX666DRAFT_609623 [Dichotomocladium elegans]
MIPMVAAWGGHDKLACGYRDGQVILWDIQAALTKPGSGPSDFRDFIICSMYTNHSAVRDIAWHGIDDPQFFSTCGNDGLVQLVQWRDPHNVRHYARVRIYTMAWPGYSDCFWFIDGENVMRGGSASVSFEKSQIRKCVSGLAISRSIAGSELHPFIAVSATDGYLKVVNPIGSLRLRDT